MVIEDGFYYCDTIIFNSKIYLKVIVNEVVTPDSPIPPVSSRVPTRPKKVASSRKRRAAKAYAFQIFNDDSSDNENGRNGVEANATIELNELDLNDSDLDISLETKVSYCDESGNNCKGWDTQDLSQAFVIIDSITGDEIPLNLSIFDLSSQGLF